MSGHLRVLVADPDPDAGRAVREELQDAGGFAVVGVATDAHDAVDLARHYHPDVAIIQARLRGGGIDAIPAVLEVAPSTKVVALDDTLEGDTPMRALRAGASGFLTPQAGAVAPLVRRVAAGEPAIPSELTRRLLETLRAMPERGWRPIQSRLTTREWQIVELLTENAGTHDIATHLYLSPETVYSHIKSIRRKLGVHTRAEAVIAAQQLRPRELHALS